MADSYPPTKVGNGSFAVSRKLLLSSLVMRAAGHIAEFKKEFQDFNARTQKVWIAFLAPTIVSGVTAASLLIGYFSHGLAGVISCQP